MIYLNYTCPKELQQKEIWADVKRHMDKSYVSDVYNDYIEYIRLLKKELNVLKIKLPKGKEKEIPDLWKYIKIYYDPQFHRVIIGMKEKKYDLIAKWIEFGSSTSPALHTFTDIKVLMRNN